MRQVVFESPGKVRWEHVPPPRLSGPAAALVEPIAVATCDLDTALVRGVVPVAGPFPLGHECVARVVEVGDDVRSVAPGDLVVVPFQISCGDCERCRRGQSAHCTAHPGTPMYGLGPFGGTEWGGMLADLAHVPYADAMLVRLPPAVAPEAAAAASDNLSDGYRAVAGALAARPDGDVLVIGGAATAVGLYAAGWAVALGAGSVTYVDQRPEPVAIAERFGADVRVGPPGRRIGCFPIVVDASGTAEGLACALRSTDRDGTCSIVAMYFSEPPLPLFDMYVSGITVQTGRVHARALMPKVLRLLAERRFDPTPVTGTPVDFGEAPEALSEATGKLLFTRRPTQRLAT